MKNIIIYRHQLFKTSEGFIFDQTRYLTRYHPIFAGRKIESQPPLTNLSIKTIQPCTKLALGRHVILRDISALSKALHHEKSSLIHAHFGVEGLYALSLAKELNLPLITTFHGFDATTNRKGLFFSKKISWLHYLAFRSRLIKQGHLFIAVSNFIRDKLLDLHFPEKKILTHYIGVDTNLIKPSIESRNNREILHVARLVDVKGTKYLLKAFSIIQKLHPDVMLTIIGDGPLRRQLQQYAENLGISSFVQFLGALPHNDVIHHMQKASIFCLPSQATSTGNIEALGMVLLEASACAIPIVATDHGGIPEAVRNEETGFLVPERNANALAERLAYLLDNETLRINMGQAGRAYVEDHFDLKKQTQKLEIIYTRYST